MIKIRDLLRKTFGLVKHHVGTDSFGNKYYSVPEQKTWTVQWIWLSNLSASVSTEAQNIIWQTIRAKRIVEAVNSKEYEYQGESIPSEWDAWIRGRRKDPPTLEEIQKNEQYRKTIKLRAMEAEERETLLQDQAYEEGLIARPRTQIQGHASSPNFQQTVPSEHPSSTANIFQPGSWTPPGPQNKET
ncbi:NADH dehydrogenase [ubiquinone] 1 alpha subcomplex assembly factor 2 isoform X1 [Erpetoichthys calabaricus]|uniref:NADH dehydrogenase [ubiquinone] 1 alpha subcomplex assembly factor 2 isoform X1 n=1 Tax=Erpetoichthys calabaricus TaxID=27687 RepID=UPI00109F63FA|nr:NADH dehydrogenase [ubiquinone] 1 alpha subcomplex assembly factor 2 isoform X1 [Erpetoichthys calabaricus]